MTIRGGGHGVGPDRGSGVVLALGLIGASVILCLAVIAWGGAALGRHRAEAAADLAALAAASAPSPAIARISPSAAVPLAPDTADCSPAARVAAANGGDLTGCQVNADGSVTVRVTVAVAGLGRATAAARAGQPP